MAGGQLANIFSFERSANLSLQSRRAHTLAPFAPHSAAGTAPAFWLDRARLLGEQDEGFHLKTETNTQVSSLKSS